MKRTWTWMMLTALAMAGCSERDAPAENPAESRARSAEQIEKQMRSTDADERAKAMREAAKEFGGKP